MARTVSVAEAAKVLGITKDGVRKRIQRKQLAVTWLDGRRMVVLEDADLSQDQAVTEGEPATGELVEALREQIRQLTDQNTQLWEQFSRVAATVDRQAQTLDRLLALPADAGPSTEPKPLTWWQRLTRKDHNSA